jgi:hypothetical protein
MCTLVILLILYNTYGAGISLVIQVQLHNFIIIFDQVEYVVQDPHVPQNVQVLHVIGHLIRSTP